MEVLSRRDRRLRRTPHQSNTASPVATVNPVPVGKPPLGTISKTQKETEKASGHPQQRSDSPVLEDFPELSSETDENENEDEGKVHPAALTSTGSASSLAPLPLPTPKPEFVVEPARPRQSTDDQILAEDYRTVIATLKSNKTPK